MEQRISASPQVGYAYPDQRCQLWEKPVAPDALGLVECACGWGGPGDPIVAARGISKVITRLDRRLANRMGQADLRRVARNASPGAGYVALLMFATTVVYLFVGFLLVGGAALAFSLAIQGVWIGAGLSVLVVLITFFSLFEGRTKLRGVEAPRARFPALAAALDEVSQCVGAPAPQRVVLVPEARAFVFQHRPLRRFFRRELVLGLGAGALPFLSDLELKSVLAHELAHYRHGHTAVHFYMWRAEEALHNFIDLLLDAFRVQHEAARGVRASSAHFYTLVATFLVWTVTLPIGVLFVASHPLRLAESRAEEFEADRTAIRAYGPQGFINGLTGVMVSVNTMRGARKSLYDEMRKHNGTNFYAEMRKHYFELPPQVIDKLRTDAAREFRSLERSHPTTPDRLRAAFLLDQPVSPPSAAPRPAVELLVPAGALNADAVESELTTLLFKVTSSRRRRH